MVSIEKMNQESPKYFPLEEYIKKIRLEKDLLEYMEEINHRFDTYLSLLSKYNDYQIIYYWISSLYEEIENSQKIEHSHLIPPSAIEANNVFFDSLQMSHKRIKELHQFVMGNEYSDYRTVPVRVSRMTTHGEEIFWNAPEVEDMKKFLNDFMTIYKSRSLSVLNTNPFFKSALVHLLFVRIHPFTDGNGRTARIISNMKFTEIINQIYGMRLKICPLNISQSILLNQYTYANRINNIYFDMEHDCNKEINQWFDFILNMVEEQLNYFHSNFYRLEFLMNQNSQCKIVENSQMENKINKMRLRMK